MVTAEIVGSMGRRFKQSNRNACAYYVYVYICNLYRSDPFKLSFISIPPISQTLLVSEIYGNTITYIEVIHMLNKTIRNLNYMLLFKHMIHLGYTYNKLRLDLFCLNNEADKRRVPRRNELCY